MSLVGLTPHNALESTKQIVQDCLNDRNSQIDMANSKYLLKIRPNKQAILYFFNSLCTAFTHNLEIEYLNSKHCLTFGAKQGIYKMVVLSKTSIYLYKCAVDREGNIASNFSTFSIPIPANPIPKFVYISPLIELPDQEICIAYTDHDEFFVIRTPFIDKKSPLECFKLNDLDQPRGVLSWFKKVEKAHYQSIFVLPLREKTENHFKFLSVRDYSLMMHLIEFKKDMADSTIKMVQSFSFYPQMLSGLRQLHLQQVVVPFQFEEQGRIRLTAVYNHKQGATIFKVCIDDIYTHSSVRQMRSYELRTRDLLLSRFQDNNVISFYQAQEGRFVVYSYSDGQFFDEKFDLFQEKPLFQSPTKIYLSVGERQLFAFTQRKIMLFSSHGAVQGMSSLQRERKIGLQKYVQLQRYDKIQEMLQKQRQSIVFGHEYEQLIENKTEGQKIIYRFVLIKILQSAQLNQIKAYQFEEQSVLNEACLNLNRGNLQMLLKAIIELKLEAFYINGIVHELLFDIVLAPPQHSLIDKDVASQIAQQLTRSSTDQVIQIMNNSQTLSDPENRRLYKLLISSVAEFAEPESISREMLDKLIGFGGEQKKYLKNLILSKRLLGPFVYFFSENSLEFTHSELNEIARYTVENEKRFDWFVRELLLGCREEWDRKKEEKNREQSAAMDYMRTKSKVIVHGLSDFADRVIPHLNQTFPGLAFLFYLTKGQRKFKSEEISELSKATVCPQTAYIMNLSVSDWYKDKSQPVLATHRLCRQLQWKNFGEEQMVRQMLTADMPKNSVNRLTWDSWKQWHSENHQLFEAFESKLRLIE